MGLAILILVFVAVFLGSVALMLMFARAPDPVERRLRDLREGRTSSTVFTDRQADEPCWYLAYAGQFEGGVLAAFHQLQCGRV